ncbi:MAG: hypothetical protein NTNFB01_18650 [Nitrospira sp.]
MCAVREGSHETDFAPGNYVQGQWMVYYRLFGQNEAGRKRYVRQAGGNRHGESGRSSFVGRSKLQSCRDLDPCRAHAFGHSQFTLITQHEHIRRRRIRFSIFRFIR